MGKRASSTPRPPKTVATAKSPRAAKAPAASKKRDLETYDHKAAKRLNNPPVGLVSPESDKPDQPKTFRFDPHADPELNFDRQGAIERALDEQIKALQNSLDDLAAANAPSDALARAREALSKLRSMRAPYLNWAGKAEHTSFEVPTVSLLVHERIEPRRIIQEVRWRNGTPKQASMFEQKEENPPLSQAIDFYGHRHGWSNRLMAGSVLADKERDGRRGHRSTVSIAFDL